MGRRPTPPAQSVWLQQAQPRALVYADDTTIFLMQLPTQGNEALTEVRGEGSTATLH